MDVTIAKSPGRYNHLLITLPRDELESAALGIASRERLMSLPGLLRHAEQDKASRTAPAECKIPVEEHLRRICHRGRPLLADDGRPTCAVIAIGNRNLGNNHGFVAWQRGESPRFFSIQGDPLDYPSYSCLTLQRDSVLAIREVCFLDDGVYEAGESIGEELEWCTFGPRILRGGAIRPIEEIVGQFYDIRHVLAFTEHTEHGERAREMIFAGYPAGFREKALGALRELGVPRARYLSTCVGLSDECVFILQREGTVEELAAWLGEAGAREAVVLEAGGSVACWAWWLYPNGGFLYSAPDYRPKASSVIAFILRHPVRTDLPPGSVSYTVV